MVESEYRKTVERGDFRCTNGLAHYRRLLQSPYRAVPSLSLSPNKGRGHNVGTAIRQNEFFSDLSDMATFTGFREEGFGSPLALTNGELKSVASESDQLESRIAYEAAQERSASGKQERAMHAKAGKDFKQLLRKKKREAKTRYESLPEFGPSQRASRRVKIDLLRATEALRLNGMKALADYLDAHVESDGLDWKYSPTVDVAWMFVRDE